MAQIERYIALYNNVISLPLTARPKHFHSSAQEIEPQVPSGLDRKKKHLGIRERLASLQTIQ